MLLRLRALERLEDSDTLENIILFTKNFAVFIQINLIISADILSAKSASLFILYTNVQNT